MVEVTSEADAFGTAEAMAYVVQHEKFTPNILARVVLSRKRVDGRPAILNRVESRDSRPA